MMALNLRTHNSKLENAESSYLGRGCLY